MPKRKILLLDAASSSWRPFLEEFFEDTPSCLAAADQSSAAGRFIDRDQPDLVFIHPSLVSAAFLQKLHTLKIRNADCRIFALSASGAEKINPDYVFRSLPSFEEFTKKLIMQLPFRKQVSLLVADDEQEVGSMMSDFLKEREPGFDVRHAMNGREALQMIHERAPDVLLLDIKMPELDGREVYRRLMEEKYEFPVVIFFDAVSTDELEEIHRSGSPAVIEKGSSQSSPPHLLNFLLKMVYFA